MELDFDGEMQHINIGDFVWLHCNTISHSISYQIHTTNSCLFNTQEKKLIMENEKHSNISTTINHELFLNPLSRSIHRSSGTRFAQSGTTPANETLRIASTTLAAASRGNGALRRFSSSLNALTISDSEAASSSPSLFCPSSPSLRSIERISSPRPCAYPFGKR